MITKICLKCGGKFNKSIFCSKKEWKDRKYCSRSCANSVNSLRTKRCAGRIPWNKGLSMPSGENNKQYTRITSVCLGCGKEFKTKKYREDTIKCCSRKCISIYRNKTPENKKIRLSEKYRLWREAVFARDNWTCQKTGERGCKLHPHHIKNFSQYPKLRFAVDNGITLSEKSHTKFHKKYGFNNNNMAQINNFKLLVASSQEA